MQIGNEWYPLWALSVIAVLVLLTTSLSGALVGFAFGTSVEGSAHSQEVEPVEIVYRPSNPMRGLDDAIREDLEMTPEAWFAEAAAVTETIRTDLEHGFMPTKVDGADVVSAVPYARSAEHARQVMTELPPQARLVPDRTGSDPWGCSPGFDVMVIDHNIPEPTSTRSALTAAHCLTGLTPSGTDHPSVNVLGTMITPTDSLLPTDRQGSTTPGSDVAVTTRSGAVSQMGDLQPVVGFVPMVPGMKICAHGITSGWRCGKVLPQWRVSAEQVTYHALGIPSAPGDSGGRILYGDRAAGVTSSYSFTPGDGGRGEKILNSWAGSLFDTAMVARERGYEIIALR